MPQRLVHLDALRALALGGIVLINATAFDNPGGPPGLLPVQTTPDRVAMWALWMFVESKFFTIFSLLFGVTASLLLTDAHSAARFRGRQLGLVLLGVLHVALVWEGDILIVYGFTGLVMPWASRQAPARVLRLVRWLLAIPAVLTVLGVIALVAAWLWSDALRAELQAADRSLLDTFSAARAEALGGHGGFVEQLVQRLQEYAVVIPLLLTRVPVVLAMFLVGFVAHRGGWLTPDVHQRRRLRAWATRALPLGVLVAAGVAALVEWAPRSITLPSLWLNQFIAGPLVATGVSAAWLAGAGAFNRLLSPLGRVSLTAYLSQTVALRVIFGVLGLAGTLGPARAAVVGLAVWLGQVGIARVMDPSRGPIERLLSAFAARFATRT